MNYSHLRKNSKIATTTLSFEQQMFLAANKLRKNLEASDYKHVVLGLIFLRYISIAFDAYQAALLRENPAVVENSDKYREANIFWVPQTARWSYLQNHAHSPKIGEIIDNAMLAIEKTNPKQLKDVLPKDYKRPTIDTVMLSELISLISDVDMGNANDNTLDMLGRVYEYFLSGFARTEGKRGGEFYTPASVVRMLVSMLEPDKGRVYDPCCGSGGMFVQSERFIEIHGGKPGDIAIYGQESNHTTWRLARMNLAVRGINADIRWNNEGSFLHDEFRDLRFDYILANPPFNISNWWNISLEEDPRWQYGKPPIGNANYAWLQHILWHLAPTGTAGVVLANGSTSSYQNGERNIRHQMVKADVIDCIVALPSQLFYSTQIPACLWFLARTKHPNGWRDRRGEILFIDACKLGVMINQNRRELTNEDVIHIANTYHAWRGEKDFGDYNDIPSFCKSVTLDEVEQRGFVLTPRRYVGVEKVEEEILPFTERFTNLKKQLLEQITEGKIYQDTILELIRKVKS